MRISIENTGLPGRSGSPPPVYFFASGASDIGSSVQNAISSLDRLLGLDEKEDRGPSGNREVVTDKEVTEVDICPSDEEEEKEDDRLAPGFMEDELGRFFSVLRSQAYFLSGPAPGPDLI